MSDTAHLAPGRPSLSLRGARVVVKRGPDKGQALRLDRDEVSVGTATSSSLVLTDPTVSRHHLVIRPFADGLLVRDLESTNGTLLDGHRIREAFLEAGNVLELGDTRLRVELVKEGVSLMLSDADQFGDLLGRSVAMKRVFAQLAAVAKEDVTVALSGETGTGKDAAAEAIHQASRRADGPFIVVDCSAIPANLMETELFGHEKGAFTGASDRRLGAFQEAHGGTLFLDEVGELPRDLQPKLLRALERHEVRPVGAARPVAVDLRVISATNRDLRLDVNRGLFREDLYYRLHVVPIQLPPLRDHKEDIPLLAGHFRRLVTGDADGHFADELLAEWMVHPWPGNVRELRNRVERALVLPDLDGQSPSPEARTFRDAKERAVAAWETSWLKALVDGAGGNLSEAARRASMDRVHLKKLLRRHGLYR